MSMDNWQKLATNLQKSTNWIFSTTQFTFYWNFSLPQDLLILQWAIAIIIEKDFVQGHVKWSNVTPPLPWGMNWLFIKCLKKIEMLNLLKYGSLPQGISTCNLAHTPQILSLKNSYQSPCYSNNAPFST